MRRHWRASVCIFSRYCFRISFNNMGDECWCRYASPLRDRSLLIDRDPLPGTAVHQFEGRRLSAADHRSGPGVDLTPTHHRHQLGAVRRGSDREPASRAVARGSGDRRDIGDSRNGLAGVRREGEAAAARRCHLDHVARGGGGRQGHRGERCAGHHVTRVGRG